MNHSSNTPPKNTPQNTWTQQHQDLHDALIAERILPNFCQRISLEHISINHTQARAWRAWANCLTNDPGWPLIQAVLELSDAWPNVWHSLPPDAWSPQTDHYNTLFFINLIPNALADQNFDLALYAFKEALAAANRALQSTTIAPNTPTAPETCFVYSIFTQYPFQDLEPLFKITTPTTAPLHNTDTEKLARFTWQALLHAQAAPLCEALTPFAIQANTFIENILEHIYADVFELIHTIDLTTAAPEQLHALFTHIISFHSRIQPRAQNFYPIFEYATVAAANTIAADVYRTKHNDEFQILQPILKLVQPFNEILCDELKTNPSIPNNFRETCAEFFVLQGELQTSTEKRLAYFEQALDIDPEYPHAQKRAAQTCLERANTLLLFTAPVPGFAVQIPGGQRLRTRVEQARDLYFRACTLDPTNELLPTYHAEIALECERFDIPFEQNPEQKTPQTHNQDHNHEP